MGVRIKPVLLGTEGVWAFGGIIQRCDCGAGLHRGHGASLCGEVLLFASQPLELVRLMPSPCQLFGMGDVVSRLFLLVIISVFLGEDTGV